jgi:hypothetical protein
MHCKKCKKCRKKGAEIKLLRKLVLESAEKIEELSFILDDNLDLVDEKDKEISQLIEIAAYYKWIAAGNKK